MYSRSYYATEERIQIPEKYDGTSLIEKSTDQADRTEQDDALYRAAGDTGRSDTANQEKNPAEGNMPRVLGLLRIPEGGFFSDFGTEELIIIGLALFMLLSDDGDIECAVMLSILLFIGKNQNSES